MKENLNKLEKQRKQQIDHLSRLPDREAADRWYREAVFPTLSSIQTQQAAFRQTAHILFLAVGTQPYSPALALAANPHEWAYLLYTTETKRFVPEVLSHYAGNHEIISPQYIGDGTDSARVMKVVHKAYLSAGEPAPGEVVVDVTSGRKSTSAALGALAAARDFRQVYLEGDPHPKFPHLILTTRFVQLPSAQLLCGQDIRAQIAALIQGGASGEALRKLKSLIEGGFAGPRDHEIHQLLTLWDHALKARGAEMAKSLGQILKQGTMVLPAKTEEVLALLQSRKGTSELQTVQAERALKDAQVDLASACLGLGFSNKLEIRKSLKSRLNRIEKTRLNVLRSFTKSLTERLLTYGAPTLP